MHNSVVTLSGAAIERAVNVKRNNCFSRIIVSEPSRTVIPSSLAQELRLSKFEAQKRQLINEKHDRGP